MTKTRFAPSPTGFLHIGGLRTALFAYLHAKKSGGIFLLRIEDTDRERFVEGGMENILNSLSWAGITPDEGVVQNKNGNIVQKGEHGPYIQSERNDIYNEHIQKLLDSGHAYHCFCSRERLGEVREEQQKNKQPTLYDGHCRNMSENEVKERLEEQDVQHVIRLRIPEEGTTSFEDSIRGTVKFKNSLIDDQVLQKSDGFPTYHLANVVDDHLMEITHVIRGEEWLSSTPKHILLYQFFGWKVPTFAHLPLLINEQKQKLSKRHGDVSVEDFKEAGYLPEALVNFVAFLGWNPGDEREIFTLSELTDEFDLSKVQKAAAVFNREKLNWVNKHYICQMEPDFLLEATKPFFQNANLDLSVVRRPSSNWSREERKL
ncbi:MAG: glutamate--tRNA ligase [Candidatus Magasanikbacteria bacterium]